MTIKMKKPGQRACDEKDAKGELCVGHLKRWYYRQDNEIAQVLGQDAEVYRCERCKTLYRPQSGDQSSAGLRYQLRPVNILGAFNRK